MLYVDYVTLKSEGCQYIGEVSLICIVLVF